MLYFLVLDIFLTPHTTPPNAFLLTLQPVKALTHKRRTRFEHKKMKIAGNIFKIIFMILFICLIPINTYAADRFVPLKYRELDIWLTHHVYKLAIIGRYNVIIQKTGWTKVDKSKTHLVLQFMSNNDGAYVATSVNTFQIENISLAY